MRCLIDAQLPPGLCDWLREQGVEASHVFEILGGQTPDASIVEHAKAEALVLITKDDDFPPALSAKRLPPRLAALRQHHQSRAARMARRALAGSAAEARCWRGVCGGAVRSCIGDRGAATARRHPVVLSLSKDCASPADIAAGRSASIGSRRGVEEGEFGG